MLTTAPTAFRPHHPLRAKAALPSLPATLELIAATYDSAIPALTLQFNQAINVDGFSATAFVVADGVNRHELVRGNGVREMLDPATIKLTLVYFDDPADPGVHLTVAEGNGISPAFGGGEDWVGVDDLALPFP